MPETPRRYSERLEQIGGKNLWGEPRFILHWGPVPLKRVGCPDMLLAPFLDCWVLAMWLPAEEFGSPDMWPEECGHYPSRGAYVIMQTFRYSNQVAMLDSPPLNLRVLETMVKVIMEHKDDSLASRKRVMEAQQEAEEAAKVKHIADVIENAKPLGEVVSFSGQKSCHSAVQQRMDLIERHRRNVELFRMQTPRGPSVHAQGR